MKTDKKAYWTLFSSAFILSACTFGGGYVIVPLLKKRFVEELHWIDEQEMLDMTAIAQSSPGAIVVNTSILLGYRVAGVLGAVLTTLGTILPPLLLLSVLSLFYEVVRDNRFVQAALKGMQAGVAAVIVDVVCSMAAGIVRGRSWWSIALMIGAFSAVFFFGISVIYVLLACGLLGLLQALIRKRKGVEK